MPRGSLPRMITTTADDLPDLTASEPGASPGIVQQATSSLVAVAPEKPRLFALSAFCEGQPCRKRLQIQGLNRLRGEGCYSKNS